MLRDLATSEACGQQNALAGFASSLGNQAKMVAEAKQFSGAAGARMQWQGQGPAGLMGAAARPGDPAQMEAFMRGFQGGLRPGVTPAFQRPQSLPESDKLAQEFQAMRLQREQSARFSQAFRDGKHPAVAPQLARQNTAPAVLSGPAAAAAQQAQQPAMHAAQMLHHQPAPFLAMGAPPLAAAAAMRPATRMQVPSRSEVQKLFEQAPKTREQAPREAKAKDAAPAEPMGPVGSGGLGMSPAMVDKLMKSDNPKWRNSKFLKFLKQVNEGEISFEDNQVVYTGKRRSAAPPAQQQQQQTGEGFDQASAWAAEFANMEGDMSGAFAGAAGAFDQAAVAPAVPRYVFQQDNPYAKPENKNKAFDIGLELMKNGNLKRAIQAFEADVQEHPNHAEGWRYLGQCHADEEEERPAIAALLKCLECDPYNLPALMMLGVSYTNDLEEERALQYLKTWCENNPSYSALGEVKRASQEIREYQQFYSSGTIDPTTVDSKLADTVMRMFQAAVKHNPNDADLHTVIGVLHHLSDDYDKAIQHFAAGVKIKPDDPYLWNKLGATQANSSRSREAVGAYQKALALKPNYMRARTNLAIAYANQKMHGKAALHYLKALRANPEVDHVWGYLKISLATMNRPDLLPFVERRDLAAFNKHFKF